MSISRFHIHCTKMVPHSDGNYVLFTDHEAEVRRLREALEIVTGRRPKPCGHPWDCICSRDLVTKALSP